MGFLNDLGRVLGQLLRSEITRAANLPAQQQTAQQSPTQTQTQTQQAKRTKQTQSKPKSTAKQSSTKQSSTTQSSTSRQTETRQTETRQTSSTSQKTPELTPYDYPGDFTGVPQLSYEADSDREADPGEVVWTWVPFEEDYSEGKDRPVLVVGRDGPWLLALPMTSQDHDRDAAQEAHEGRYWMDIGTGEWDNSGRASEVRLNRILRVDPSGIRRLAGRLAKARFEQVAAEVMQYYR